MNESRHVDAMVAQVLSRRRPMQPETNSIMNSFMTAASKHTSDAAGCVYTRVARADMASGESIRAVDSRGHERWCIAMHTVLALVAVAPDTLLAIVADDAKDKPSLCWLNVATRANGAAPHVTRVPIATSARAASHQPIMLARQDNEHVVVVFQLLDNNGEVKVFFIMFQF